jgi:SAM-dependent methyltransferase
VAGTKADVQQQIDWFTVRWTRSKRAIPGREARFRRCSLRYELLPTSFVVLDLACGPGSISQRLLARFRNAQAIAVDMDPVMLAIGRGTLGTMAACADQGIWRRPTGWALGETQIDAVSVPPHCIGWSRNRWVGSTTTSLVCCSPAAVP